MTFDFGLRAKSRLRGPALKAVVGGVVVMAAVAAAAVWASLERERGKEEADARAYGASGPPCPTITPARLAMEGPHLRHRFEFGDMALAHAFGDADCAWIRDATGRYPICRFTSPGSLELIRSWAQRSS